MAEFASLNGYDVKDKKAVRVYDNVEAMKEDYSIQAGQTVQTLGYYEPNDGGSAEYIISDDNTLTPDESLIIQLENGLFATLIIKNNTINVKQFGIIGDGEVDESDLFQIAINECENKTLYIPNISILLSDTINLPDKINIVSDGKLLLDGDVDYLLYKSTTINNIDIKINGVIIEKIDDSFTKYNRFIRVEGGNLIVKNSTFINYGTAIHHLYGNNLYCDNNLFSNAYGILPQYGYGIDTSSLYVNLSNNRFINDNTNNGRHAIYLNGERMIKAYINNIYVEKWHHNPFMINISNTTVTPIVNIENCIFKDTCIEAPGDNPNAVIGSIAVSDVNRGIVNINNIVGENLTNCLITSVTQYTNLNIHNIKAYHKLSTGSNVDTIYIRYGDLHIIENILSYNSVDTNYKYCAYIRDTSAIINEIYDMGTGSNEMILSDNSSVNLGFYKTTKSVRRIINGGTVTPLNTYSV